MESVVQKLKKDLEARGECVHEANNPITGWFGVSPKTWQARIERARRDGREGPNLIVYKTKSDDVRDHYVIPYSVIRDLLVDETITISEVNLPPRWHLQLLNNKLWVTHHTNFGKIDVSQYHGARLLVEPEFENIENAISEEVAANEKYREGAVHKILINAYERDPTARERCVDHYGRQCFICKMAFVEVYGPDAAHIIHVHHIVPLSEIGKEYEIDPIEDLRPICPNCHAVIHSQKPARTIDEVAKLLKQ